MSLDFTVRSCSVNKNRHLQVTAMVVALAMATLIGCGGSSSQGTRASRPTKKPVASKQQAKPAEAKPAKPVEIPQKDAIAILYYEDDSPFNAAFRAGATDAAKERETEIEWLTVSDENSQNEVFDRAISERFAAICICPMTPDTLADRTKKANDAKIPVIVCERPLSLENPIDDAVPFVATDHAYCGQVLAEEAKKALGTEGRLLLVGGEVGVEADRAMNVTFALKETDIEIVTDTELSTDSIAEALTKFVEDKEEDTDLAIVAVSAEGAKQVLEWKESEAGEDYEDMPLLGFGSWEGIADAIESEKLTAVVLEDPNGIGAAAVMTAASALDGEEVGGLVTTGEHLVTAENLEEPRTAELLKTNMR